MPLQPLIAQFDGQMIVLTDTGFHLLARWGLEIDDENMIRLSIAEFSL